MGHPGGELLAQPTAQGRATMLVLSRKKNESIIINDDIIITVVEIRGDKVRLGIQAPASVSVHRREVYEAIHGRAPEIAPPKENCRKPSE
ncbi:MAG: carbon storage regulator CsrA [Gemmatales bacterium]|nr:carbon storage regulator CsrA [Gemmatales bacterium]